MAAVMNARQDRQPTISFTLPISCQVCLGKVKQPVLCPNNHVFCSPCMDMWMQRNHQCPACRTPINPSNPVKHIKGGLTQAEDSSDTMSNPSLRKARFDLLYKEYEEEFVRLESETRLLKTENSILKDQLKKGGGKSGASERSEFLHPDSVDGGNLLALNKKLQDAQKLYERLKTDMSRVKQENNSLKDENVNLNRENEKLRMEMTSRSPQRYGRYTVATLESKNESNEKEIRQLNKALQRSDKYVEDLEAELSHMKSSSSSSSSSVRSSSVPPKSSSTDLYRKSDRKDQFDNPPENPAKRQLFGSSMDDLRGLSSGDTTDDRLRRKTETSGVGGGGYNEKGDSTLWSSMNGSRNAKPKSTSVGIEDQPSGRSSRGRSASASPTKDRSPKKVHFSLPKRTETSSFELDQPSPQTPSSSLGSLSISNGRASPSDLDSKYFDEKYTEKYSSTRSSKWQGDIPDGNFDRKGRSDLKSKDRFEDTSSQLSMPEFETMPTKRSRYGNDLEMSDLDDTQTIRSELDDLNISLTPELSDCMKLLNRAEKKSYVSEGAGGSSAYPADKYSSIPSSSSLSTAPAQPFRSGSDLPMTQWEHEYYSQVKSNPYRNQSVSQSTVGTHDRISSSGGGLNYDSQALRQPSSNSYTPTSSYTIPYTSTASVPHDGSGKSGTTKAAGDLQSLDDKLFLLGVTGNRNKVPNSDLLDSKSFPKSDDFLRSSYDSYNSSRKVPPSSFHSSLPITTTENSGQSHLPPRDPNHRRSSLDYGKDLYLDPLKAGGSQNLLASQTSGRKYSSLNNIPVAVSASSSLSGYSSSSASHLHKLNQLFPTSSSSMSLRPSSYSSSSSSSHPQAISSNPSYLFAGSASAAGAATSLPSSYSTSSSHPQAMSTNPSYLFAGSASATGAATSLPSSYSTSMSRVTSALPSSSSTSSLSSAVTSHSALTYPISSTYTSSSMGSSSVKLSSQDDFSYPVGNSNNNRRSNYSYESTAELSSSFVPDPKKRLFESGDDFDLTLSPIKSTRIT